jgi:serine/threonine protein kinase
MCKRPDIYLARRKNTNLWLQHASAIQTMRVVETEVCKLLNKCSNGKRPELYDGQRKWQREIGLYHRNEVQIGDLLGQGAFSEVYQVVDFQVTAPQHQFTKAETWVREMQQKNCLNGTSEYCMKHLKSDLPARRFNQAARDLVRESEFLASLSHPFILKVHGWAVCGKSGFADGHDGYFLILDKLEETLSARISKWQQEETYGLAESIHMPNYAEKIKCAFQIASGLKYLHDHRIVFRDLKPDNVGFKRDGTTQIFDFGLCRELPEQMRSFDDENVVFHMSSVGTRRYMAPETVIRTGYNLKVDVYSWAMVLYEMLALKRPYNLYNREVHKILVCEGGQRPCLEPYWPNEVRDLMARAWEQSPADRPSMTQILVTLEPLVNVAQMEILSPSLRSLKAVYEMADLFSPRSHHLAGPDRTESTEIMTS